MDKKEFLENILQIHSVSVATIDKERKPSSRIIDMMYLENNCLFFLTARGKSLYEELMTEKYISLSCTENRKAYTLKGYIEKADKKYLSILFENNQYMYEIYSKDKMNILEVFKIYKWSGEYFDLTTKPITRLAFSHNFDEISNQNYVVVDKCISCKKCMTVCPQKCINFETQKAYINTKHCLKCGACKEICPVQAIEIK